MSVSNNLKIELLQKIDDLEQKGVKLPKTFNIEEPIENLTFQHSLLQKKYKKIREEHNYKNLSHFKDMVKNMGNEPNKNIPYTDTQFEEDLKKWVAETKTTQNDKYKQLVDNLQKLASEIKNSLK